MQRNDDAYNGYHKAIRANQCEPCGIALSNILKRITQRADRFIQQCMHGLTNGLYTDLRVQQPALIPVNEKHRVNTERALTRSVKV